MHFFLAVVALLIVFTVVIGLHEVGHAVVARWFGVKIQRIALGFGRPFLRWKGKQGIDWVIGIWPLGGYVQLLNTRIQATSSEETAYCFDKKAIGVRCLVLLAGGAVNFLVAWIAFTLVFSVGYRQYSPVIAQVVPDSVAAQAGLQSGDRLLSIEGKQINSWQQAGMTLITHLDLAKIQLQVVNDHRQSRMLILDLYCPNWLTQKGSFFKRLGIEPRVDRSTVKSVSSQALITAIPHALTTVVGFCANYVSILKLLITGHLPLSLLLGPIGLLTLSIDSFTHGFSAFMSFIAQLSLVVGLVNYLPIPGLDGGAIFYLLLEKIRKKPLSIAMEILLYRLAVIAFFVFLVQLLLNDVSVLRFALSSSLHPGYIRQI